LGFRSLLVPGLGIRRFVLSMARAAVGGCLAVGRFRDERSRLQGSALGFRSAAVSGLGIHRLGSVAAFAMLKGRFSPSCYTGCAPTRDIMNTTGRRRIVCTIAVVFVAFIPHPAPAVLYWDADGTASGNNAVTGAGLGGSGSWDAAGNWFD